MRKWTISSILVAVLTTGIILTMAVVPIATAEFYCNDRQTFSAFGNIIVPEGQTCVLDQFNVVKGDIIVKEGATLVVCADNDIAGSIIADGAETVALIDSLGGVCIGALDNVSNVVETSSIDYTVDAVNKVTICHKPGTAAEKEIQVPPSAVKGHLDHGDKLGPCGILPPPKALGLAIIGNIDVANTNNFILIGNTDGITIVRGDVTVQNTQSVSIINVGGIAMAGHGIGGDLTISSSASCSISGNMVVGSIQLDGCSNLAN